MKKYILSISVLFAFSFFNFQLSIAQNLSAYVNTLNEFDVFEDSFVHEIDYLKPTDYKIGGNSVVFTDSKGNFKIYQYGHVDAPIDGLVDGYEVSTSLVLIKNPNILYVYDHGKLVSLSRFVSAYSFNDSIAAVSDYSTRDFSIYYNDRLRAVEPGNTPELAAQVIASGSNVIAYATRTKVFKIFYRDSIYVPETEYPKQIKAGNNLVVYLDQYEDGLYVFYQGETKMIEPYAPKFFQVANDIIAYVDRDGIFKIFCKGNLFEMGNYTPLILKVKDNLVIYSDRLGYCNVFYNCKSYQLENYMPNNITYSQNTLFYSDQSNRLKIFAEGVLHEMPIETYLKVTLDYDVVKMQLPANRWKFFSGGKVY